MKIKFLIASFLIIIINQVNAKPVTKDKAIIIAKHFFHLQINMYSNKNIEEPIVLYSQQKLSNDSLPLWYAINFDGGGFVIVSGDDAVIPVLGYSEFGFFGGIPEPPSFTAMMNGFEQQINYCRQNSIEPTKSIGEQWKLFSNITNTTPALKGGTKSVNPLLICSWDQGALYNALCPQDPNGPAGRVYAGCVATMMGMTMYYYRFPSVGSGSHAYNSDYGYLSVDFSQSHYDYFSMPSQLQTGSYDVAKLLYDCGVAVDMMYSPYGSGAYMQTTADAMITYFGYNPGLELIYKDDYSDQEWKDLLISNLDAGHPLPYAGYDVSSGHAFVCDGYQGSDYFHFNWGWSGYYNGYFYLDNLNPSYNFSSGQQFINNCYPASVSYPNGCGNYTLTANSGSITDGSGPADYLSNQSCSWLIDPVDSVTSIKISFKSFDTEANFDSVSIYNGANSFAPLIQSFSGSGIPSSFTVQGNKAFITFHSNGNNQSHGWFADYNCTTPLFCQSMTFLQQTSGSVSDGSEAYNYNNNTMCRWIIQPPGAEGIQIQFTNFDLQTNDDYLAFYDGNTYSYQLIASFDGNIMPADFTALTNKLLVVFRSDDQTNENGWSFNYQGSAAAIGENSSKGIWIYDDKLHLTNFSSGKYQINILSITGQIVKEFSSEVENSNETIYLPLNNLSNGVYILRLFNDQNDVVIRFVR